MNPGSRLQSCEENVLEMRGGPIEVLDPTPPPKVDLRNLEAVRREMARVYREMRSGDLPHENGTRLVYVLDRIGKLIEVAQVEARLIELERKLLK